VISKLKLELQRFHATFLLTLTMTASLAELEAQLQTADPAARRAAAEQLCRRGEEARPAAVALVKALGDDDEETQQWAYAALEGLGPPEASAVPTLAALLQTVDVEADTAYWAATLLGRSKAGAASAVEPLTLAALEHFSLPVRERAVWALGQIGRPASGAQGVLERLASGAQPRLARLATAALERIGE
jgi:HEAT repeat protein